jgi:hypothetical protein
MADIPLKRLCPSLQSGEERFRDGSRDLGVTALDYWRWSMSDMVANTMRGFLAEFLVAKALGIATDQARVDWGSFDLKTEDGVRIEVKSSAFIQTWGQEKLSRISFKMARRRGWDPETNKTASERQRHADIYVFALIAHRDKATIDPLDLSQWQFWALPCRVLEESRPNQKSLSLTTLRKLAGESVGFANLAPAFREAVRRQRGEGG